MDRLKRTQFWGTDEDDDQLVREIIDGTKTATVCKADEYHTDWTDYDLTGDFEMIATHFRLE